MAQIHQRISKIDFIERIGAIWVVCNFSLKNLRSKSYGYKKILH